MHILEAVDETFAYLKHIEATAFFYLNLIFKALQKQPTLIKIFPEPQSHKCWYKSNTGESVFPPLSCSLFLFCSLYSVRLNCLALRLQDIVNHISKHYHLLFFVWCANWCEHEGGALHRDGGRLPSDHQSQQSSLQWQAEVLRHFWLTWLMCFWSAGGEYVKLALWHRADRSHITVQLSVGISKILYSSLRGSTSDTPTKRRGTVSVSILRLSWQLW